MSETSSDALSLIRHTLDAWASRNLDETMRYMAPDIDFLVNVDAEIAPFAASARGRENVRTRLQLLLDTFHFDALVAEEIRIAAGEPNIARVRVAYYFREKTTNQRLNGRFRLVVYVDGEQILRIEELHDGPYIEAFARLVKAMAAAPPPQPDNEN